ncbi:hypothetical protein PR202_ga26288 [Eleusine coracana subsp. coracana]|uniref:Uncharacterized protein n=1 Tax=Eleusine coracana subsp. coracana TaxID=191504 RepID=A0AAV5DDM9_ELECO|nr:hypothetical protein PR202_ga26288 [Eleusine coracana subsp. coracana]
MSHRPGERLRRLALETIDLAKDPYFMRTNLGSYEQAVPDAAQHEGILAHTQGSGPTSPSVLPASQGTRPRSPSPTREAAPRKSAAAVLQAKTAWKLINLHQPLGLCQWDWSSWRSATTTGDKFHHPRHKFRHRLLRHLLLLLLECHLGCLRPLRHILEMALHVNDSTATQFHSGAPPPRPPMQGFPDSSSKSGNKC